MRFFPLLFLAATLTGCSRPASPPESSPSPAPSASPSSPGGALTFEQAQQALKQRPDDPQAHVDLAFAAPREKAALAAKELRAALRLDPKHTRAYQGLLAMYEAFGYTDRQLELVQARTRAVPEDVEAWRRLADLYTTIHASADADAALAQAAKLAPEASEVVVARALHLYRQGRAPEAVKMLGAFHARHPTDHVVLYRLSESQRAAGSFAEAEKSIRAALKLAPERPEYRRQLAHILVTSGKTERLAEAEKEARAAVEKSPDDVDARFWLAQALDLQSKAKEAIAAYEEVTRRDVTYENAAFRLGYLYRRNGRAKEGDGLMGLNSLMEANQKKLADAAEKLRKEPSVLAHHLAVADLHARGEQWGVAVAILRHARTRFADAPEVKNRLRELLNKAGRKTEAAEVLL